MIKVTIKGEVFSFDESAYPMDEAIALEDGLGMPYGRYQEGLSNGSAKAIAGLAWCVLRRNGREVPLETLLSGEYTTADITAEREGEDTDPTASPAASAGGSGSGSARSRSSTTTPPPKSAP